MILRGAVVGLGGSNPKNAKCLLFRLPGSYLPEICACTFCCRVGYKHHLFEGLKMMVVHGNPHVFVMFQQGTYIVNTLFCHQQRVVSRHLPCRFLRRNGARRSRSVTCTKETGENVWGEKSFILSCFMSLQVHGNLQPLAPYLLELQLHLFRGEMQPSSELHFKYTAHL